MYGIHQCCYYGSADSLRDTEQLLWKHALFAMRDCTLGRSDPPIPQCHAFRAVKTLTRRKMDGPICHTNMWRPKSNQICVYCGRGCVHWYEWSASWLLVCLLWNDNRCQKTPQQNHKFYIVPSSQVATHLFYFFPYPDNSCLWPELAENGSCLCRPAYRLTPGAVLAKSIFI